MNLLSVKLLIYDCDGVLTDNRVLVDETGKESVFFHRGDGYGIQMLKQMGIKQMIISTEQNSVVERRAEKLSIDIIHAVEDKRIEVIRCCRKCGISTEQAMFIGNDLNDFDAMKTTGFCGCPQDAEPEIKEISHWVSTKAGGHGVIRELYRILSVREV